MSREDSHPDRLARDLRAAGRGLWRAPGFTAVVLAVMALSMATSTAVFSLADGVALRRLPFERPDRLVSLEPRIAGFAGFTVHAALDFLALRPQHDVFEGVAAIATGSLTLGRDDGHEPAMLRVQRVSAEFFEVLRARPAIGRPFTGEHEVDGRDGVAVISHGLWQRRFGGASDILGRRLPADRGEIEIIGVMPAGFAYPVGATQATDLWIPLVIPERERLARVSAYLTLIARLKDGVTIEQAQARLDQLAAADPGGTDGGQRPKIVLRDLREAVTADVRPWMWMLLAAVACVLLLAFANIANLLLVRATSRTHEFGVRAALGASRRDLLGLLLAEGLLLSIAGTALGVITAIWGIEALRAVLPPQLPRLADVAVDGRVLAASALAAIVAGIGFGLAPMVQGTATPGRLLLESGRMNTASGRHQWLRTTLLVAEVALAVVLLVGTALFVTSFWKVTGIDVGFDYRNVLAVDVSPGTPAQTASPALARVVEAVSAIPGVEAAALANGNVPLSLSFRSAPLGLPGRQLPEGAPRSIGVSEVSPAYFGLLGIPLRAGRQFVGADGDARENVVILNETAAAVLFPGEDPVGQLVSAGFGRPQTVIGVAGDVRGFGPERGVELQAFRPIVPGEVGRGTLLVRFRGRGSAIVPQVQAAIWSEFPDLAVPPPLLLEDGFGVLVAERRASMILLGVFGMLAVTIAAVGIYGVMSHVVARRAREIGIRMALGASASRIVGSVLRRASAQVGAGLILGFGAAWLGAASVESFLFSVGPHDLRLYAIVAAAIVAAALAAAWMPARRAARVDPLVVLRSE